MRYPFQPMSVGYCHNSSVVSLTEAVGAFVKAFIFLNGTLHLRAMNLEEVIPSRQHLMPESMGQGGGGGNHG